MGLFKIKNHPITSVELTDANTKFVSAISGTGSDLTGNGTRANPYATITKAGNSTIVFIGKTVENITGFSSGPIIIGDGESSEIYGNIALGGSLSSQIINCKIKNITAVAAVVLKNTQINSITGGHPSCEVEMSNCVITDLNGYSFSEESSSNGRNTIFNFRNFISYPNRRYLKNYIFITSIDLFNYISLSTLTNIPVFKNCLFRKATVWKWNGATINTSSVTDVDSLIAVMTAYGVAMSAGAAKTYFQAMFPAAGGTNILFSCRVVDDSVNPIFNRYDINGNPIDYTLKLDSSNIALTMSDTMSYVGCYQASAKTDGASPVLEFNAPVNVDAAGAETTGDPKLLVYPGDGKFQIGVEASTQIRNRCTSSNVVKFERGFTLTGFQSQMKSALGSRFSFGKFQKYNTTDAPCLPMESLEVIPYDAIDTPSATFPRFSAMFNDKCQMWYHTAGAKINQPILFSDLETLFSITITQEPSLTPAFISEYGAWAVTNADMVSYLLSNQSGCALRNIPLYFAKIELNLNYYN